MEQAQSTCVVCGRRMPQRKAARAGDVRKYCSAACRSHKLQAVDHALEAAILGLLAAAGRGRTVSPAQAVAEVYGQGVPPPAEAAERARRAARRLVSAGKIEILQQGRVVDPSTARGPLELRLRQG